MPLDDEFVELAARVRNWGRWGDDDELGTLNLIDAAAVKRGAACVQTGKAFSLAIPLDDHGPQIGFIPGRYNPIHKVFQINEVTIGDPDGTRFSDDQMDLALQACTHWDALVALELRRQPLERSSGRLDHRGRRGASAASGS